MAVVGTYGDRPAPLLACPGRLAGLLLSLGAGPVNSVSGTSKSRRGGTGGTGGPLTGLPPTSTTLPLASFPTGKFGFFTPGSITSVWGGSPAATGGGGEAGGLVSPDGGRVAGRSTVKSMSGYDSAWNGRSN